MEICPCRNSLDFKLRETKIFSWKFGKLLKKIQVFPETLKCLYGKRIGVPFPLYKRIFNSFKIATSTFRIVFWNLLGLGTNGLSLFVTVLSLSSRTKQYHTLLHHGLWLHSLCKKCSRSEFFWSLLSRIWTEYGDLQSNFRFF